MEDLTREILAFLLHAAAWDAQHKLWNTPQLEDFPGDLEQLRRRVDTANGLITKLFPDRGCKARELVTLRRLARKHPEEAIAVVSSQQIGDECVRRALIRMKSIDAGRSNISGAE